VIHAQHFYIDGQWMQACGPTQIPVINPATEGEIAVVTAATRADVDRAVAAAKAAFPNFSRTTLQERIELLRAVVTALRRRETAIAEMVSLEMGAPLASSAKAQGAATLDSFTSIIDILAAAPFTSRVGGLEIVREPIGVCALICPWNGPVMQIAGKVAAALAAGCVMIVKPSELAPLSPILFAEALEEAGVPPGVFNLLNGAAETGALICSHADVDMVSFTGSTLSGIRVAHAAADTVKRVHQELGGKGANIILPDADLAKAVSAGVLRCFSNSGQVCSSPTRMLVPLDAHEEAVKYAKATAAAIVVGNPADPRTQMGPVANRAQFEKVRTLIQVGIDEGADLVIGGTARPPELNRGFYIRPTIFSHVTPEMTIAQTEIFGPVLSIIPYRDEADAVRIANGTPYGLQAYVNSSDLEHARRVARQIASGVVIVNYAARPPSAPFGGYKQSGNGRQSGLQGLLEYTEVKAIVTG
jgi:aldehyde dehydrogenase (NAD+)